jgi:hypothetical protein
MECACALAFICLLNYMYSSEITMFSMDVGCRQFVHLVHIKKLA